LPVQLGDLRGAAVSGRGILRPGRQFEQFDIAPPPEKYIILLHNQVQNLAAINSAKVDWIRDLEQEFGFSLGDDPAC
jgi:hypothetical protein